MGLDGQPPRNPNMQKGMKSLNPKGRPKGPSSKVIDVKRRVMGKWHTHPVDKLISIANFIQATNPEMSAKIWIRLLDSMEAEERKKKSSSSPVPLSDEPEDKNLDEAALLEALENDGQQAETSSENPSVAESQTPISPKASATKDLPGHTEK